MPALLLLAGLAWPVAGVALGSGDRAPAVSVDRLKGEGTVSLERYRGKVVYLDFWASWCAPCLVSLPALEALRKELPEDRFQIVAINVDRDPRKALEFLRRHPVGYPSGTDPEGRLPARFEIETMPSAFLIDRRGVIRYVHRGFREGDIDEIRARIRALLEEGP